MRWGPSALPRGNRSGRVSERETERQRQRETERQRDRETETETETINDGSEHSEVPVAKHRISSGR